MIPVRSLGRSGFSVTELGLGAAFIGGRDDPSLNDPEMASDRFDDLAIATVHRAIELGIRHIDTSPLYGPSERRIGAALESVDTTGLTISTKVGTHPERPYSYTASDLRWSLEQSFTLLGRDHIDLVLIHDPPSMEPVLRAGDGFDALETMRSEGMLDFIGLGVRDHDFHRMAIELERVDVILTFADYNVVRRHAASLITQAHSAGVGVLLGSPQMLGLLAKGDPLATAGRRLLDYAAQFSSGDVEAAAEWSTWCRERDVDLRHLNMRFVLQNHQIGAVLTGAATPGEIETNVFEAYKKVPDDVWAEAMLRIADLDEQDALG
jgi:aryl-alcohol dehydrogenase-like predicted oxidoreductase